MKSEKKKVKQLEVNIFLIGSEVKRDLHHLLLFLEDLSDFQLPKVVP